MSKQSFMNFFTKSSRIKLIILLVVMFTIAANTRAEAQLEDCSFNASLEIIKQPNCGCGGEIVFHTHPLGCLGSLAGQTFEVYISKGGGNGSIYDEDR
jgi:hypothetical protein